MCLWHRIYKWINDLKDGEVARLPADITTAAKLARWLKRTPGADAGLRLTRAELAARLPGDDVEAQFPDELSWEGQRYPLAYRFEPGGEADGVSVTVPVALLNRVPRYRFDWLVPGLLREKCEALVRGLPKRIRRNLVPVPDTVAAALGDLAPADRPLPDALAPVLSRLGGCRVEAADFDPGALDDFYRMNVRVVDAEGGLLAQGRDLEALVARFRAGCVPVWERLWLRLTTRRCPPSPQCFALRCSTGTVPTH